MAQPIRNTSPEPLYQARSIATPATVSVAAPSVHARAGQATEFLVVRYSGNAPDFDEMSSKYADQKIHTLDLRGADMRRGTWYFLLQYLNEKTSSLDTLDLGKNLTGARDDTTFTPFRDFMAGLKRMPSRLIFRSCYIGSKFLAPISSRLKVDNKLQSLDLAQNRLCPADILSLADALQPNRTLSELNLALNNLDTTSVLPLTRLLANSTSLKKLDLSGNLFTPEDKAALQQANAARTGAPVELAL